MQGLAAFVRSAAPQNEVQTRREVGGVHVGQACLVQIQDSCGDRLAQRIDNAVVGGSVFYPTEVHGHEVARRIGVEANSGHEGLIEANRTLRELHRLVDLFGAIVLNPNHDGEVTKLLDGVCHGVVDGSSGVSGKGIAAVKRVAHRVVDGRALRHAVDAGAVLVRYELLEHVVERRLAVGLDVVGGGALK
jgi:hypothetical protein